jgi:hypothetical protein
MLEGLSRMLLTGQVIFFPVMLGSSAMGMSRELMILGRFLMGVVHTIEHNNRAVPRLNEVPADSSLMRHPPDCGESTTPQWDLEEASDADQRRPLVSLAKKGGAL